MTRESHRRGLRGRHDLRVLAKDNFFDHLRVPLNARLNHDGVVGDHPREQALQVNLFGQLVTDHFFPHLFGIIRLLTREHVCLRLNYWSVESPVRERHFSHHCFTFAEIQLDQSLPILVVIKVNFDVQVTDISLESTLLQVVHAIAWLDSAS